MLIGLMAQSKRKFMQAYPRRTTVDETKITSAHRGAEAGACGQRL